MTFFVVFCNVSFYLKNRPSGQTSKRDVAVEYIDASTLEPRELWNHLRLVKSTKNKSLKCLKLSLTLKIRWLPGVFIVKILGSMTRRRRINRIHSIILGFRSVVTIVWIKINKFYFASINSLNINRSTVSDFLFSSNGLFYHNLSSNLSKVPTLDPSCCHPA